MATGVAARGWGCWRVAFPALLHIGLVDAWDEPMLAIAWPVTFATDLAVGYFISRLIFGAPGIQRFLFFC